MAQAHTEIELTYAGTPEVIVHVAALADLEGTIGGQGNGEGGSSRHSDRCWRSDLIAALLEKCQVVLVAVLIPDRDALVTIMFDIASFEFSIDPKFGLCSGADFQGALLRARVLKEGLLETKIGGVVDVTVFDPEVQFDRAVYGVL